MALGLLSQELCKTQVLVKLLEYLMSDGQSSLPVQSRPGPPGRLRARSVSHSESIL